MPSGCSRRLERRHASPVRWYRDADSCGPLTRRRASSFVVLIPQRAAPLGGARTVQRKFLAAVLPDKLTAVPDSSKSGPFKGGAFVKISEGSTDSSLVATVQGGDRPLEVSISTDGAGLMDGLLPASSAPKTGVSSWADFDKAFEAFPAQELRGVRVRALLGRSRSGRCTRCARSVSRHRIDLQALHPGDHRRADPAGKGSWEEKIAIREDSRAFRAASCRTSPRAKSFR